MMMRTGDLKPGEADGRQQLHDLAGNESLSALLDPVSHRSSLSLLPILRRQVDPVLPTPPRPRPEFVVSHTHVLRRHVVRSK